MMDRIIIDRLPTGATMTPLPHVSELRPQGCDLGSQLSQIVSAHAEPLTPFVQVSVSGRPLLLPRQALYGGLAALGRATGEYVRLEDYAVSVARVLGAMEKHGLVTFRTKAGPQHRPSKPKDGAPAKGGKGKDPD